MANLKIVAQVGYGAKTGGSSSPFTANGNTGYLPVGDLTYLEIDINVTAITGTLQFTYYRVDPVNNVLYQVWQSSSLSATGQTIADIGPGLTTDANVGQVGQLSWALSGAGPDSFTATIVGK